MSIEPRDFRDTVGCFATGITIITTVDEAGVPIGLTANSFTSLSLDPPMVLFCLDRRVASFDAFQSDGHFAVNILSTEQQLKERFSIVVGTASSVSDDRMPSYGLSIRSQDRERHHP